MPTITLGALGALVKANMASLGEIVNISMAGYGTFWSAVNFVQSGASKSGQFNATTAWSKITGLVADTTNYPGSVVTSDRLMANGSGTNKQIQAGFNFTPATAANSTAQLRIKQNGTVIGSPGVAVTVPAFGNANAFCTVTGVNISSTDYFEVEVIGTATPPRTSNGYLRALN